MANRNNDATTKLGIDVASFKKGLTEASNQIKQANAEFKKASAGMDNWSKSTEGVQAKIKQLQSVLDAENKKLDTLKAQLDAVKKSEGENSDAAKQLEIAITNQEASIKKTEKSLKDYNNKLTDIKKSEEATTTATSKLNTTIDAQEKELSDLKEKYANVVLEQGKNSKEAKELSKQIGVLSGDLQTNKQKLNDAKTAADSFDKGMDEAGKSAKDAGKDAKEAASGGFTVLKGALADLLSKGIQTVVQGFKDLAKASADAFEAFDEGRDKVIKATGATGKSAEDLTKSYKNVAKTIVGDFSTIGGALGEVSTRFDVTGDDLESMTKDFLKFADITGTDATNAVRLVSRAMNNAGIDTKDYNKVLDALAKASQKSGVSIDKLAENLTKYGVPMRELGFDTNETIAVFAQWEKAGVNTETAFAGMQKAVANWQKEGKDAKTEFIDVLDKIAHTEDSTKAAQIAVEAFGKKAGPELAELIRSGKFEFSDFINVIENSEGTVNDTFEGTQDASDKLKLALQNLKITVGDMVDKFLQKHGPAIESFINDKVLPTVESALEWIGNNGANLVNSLVEKVKDAKSAFSRFWEITQAVFSFLKGAATTAVNKIRKAFEKIQPIAEGVFKWLVDHKTELLAVLGGIGAAFVAWNIVSLVSGLMSFVAALKAMGAAAVVATAKQWLLNAAMMANPIGLVVAAIAGLVAAFVILWNKSEKFRNFWKNLMKNITEWGAKAWDKIGEFFYKAGENIKKPFVKVGEWFSARWKDITSAFAKVGEFFKQKFEKAYTNVKTAFELIGGWFSDRYTDVKNAFSAVGSWFKERFEEAYTNVKTAFELIGSWFSDRYTDIKNAFKNVGEWFKEKFEEAYKNIKDIFTGIGTWFTDRYTDIQNALIGVSGWFKEQFETGYSNITDAFGNIGSWFGDRYSDIKNAFSGVGSWFKKTFGDAWDNVKKIFKVSTVKTWFSDVWVGIKSVFTGVSGWFEKIFNGVKGIIVAPLNAIIDGLNYVIDGLNSLSIDIPSWVPWVGGETWGVNISKLNHIALAKGGVLKKGQVGLLEGNGAEAVVPLDQNKKWINATAKDMKNALQANGVINNGNTITNYNFTQNNTSPKPLNRLEIYRQTKNQFNLFSGVN